MVKRMVVIETLGEALDVQKNRIHLEGVLRSTAWIVPQGCRSHVGTLQACIRAQRQLEKLFERAPSQRAIRVGANRLTRGEAVCQILGVTCGQMSRQRNARPEAAGFVALGGGPFGTRFMPPSFTPRSTANARAPIPLSSGSRRARRPDDRPSISTCSRTSSWTAEVHAAGDFFASLDRVTQIVREQGGKKARVNLETASEYRVGDDDGLAVWVRNEHTVRRKAVATGGGDSQCHNCKPEDRDSAAALWQALGLRKSRERQRLNAEDIMPSPVIEPPRVSAKSEAEARRDFLKNVGKATATLPAVALLLAASEKSASAHEPASGGSGSS